mmetsp:Transcript_204/g.884  ORF Transcript_204/g.884 Transcript_204/m.884 type:complete len:304 (+) Transcript_204:583-1494(+)
MRFLGGSTRVAVCSAGGAFGLVQTLLRGFGFLFVRVCVLANFRSQQHVRHDHQRTHGLVGERRLCSDRHHVLVDCVALIRVPIGSNHRVGHDALSNWAEETRGGIIFHAVGTLKRRRQVGSRIGWPHRRRAACPRRRSQLHARARRRPQRTSARCTPQRTRSPESAEARRDCGHAHQGRHDDCGEQEKEKSRASAETVAVAAIPVKLFAVEADVAVVVAGAIADVMGLVAFVVAIAGVPKLAGRGWRRRWFGAERAQVPCGEGHRLSIHVHPHPVVLVAPQDARLLTFLKDTLCQHLERSEPH